jgi:hypothetical protein
MSVPQGLTQRAVDSVLGLEEQALLQKLTRKLRGQIDKGGEALERLTWRPVPAAVALRGEPETLSPEVIRRDKRFGDLDIGVEIEKSGPEAAIIRVTDRSSRAHPQPVRVALFSGEREVASALLGEVPVVFEDIALGIYALVFVSQNKELGKYAFELAGQL